MADDMDYRAETFRVDRIGDHGVVHFADLKFLEEVHSWDRDDESRFDAVKKLILDTITKDSHLENREVAKYFLAFPSEIVVSCYGTPEDNETDALPERYKAYKVNDDLRGLTQIDVVPPCRLEHSIASHEGDLWEDSRTINEYYNKERKSFSPKHPYPNKKFE